MNKEILVWKTTLIFITVAAIPRALRINDISKATQEDNDLCALRDEVQTDHWPTSSQLRLYKHINDEITVDFHSKGIITGNTKSDPLVVTTTGCKHCTNSHSNPQAEPMQSPPMPDHQWEKVKIGFHSPFESGHYMLVAIDCYSRFPEVEVLKSLFRRRKLFPSFTQYL